jgi:hypothetical protein
MSIVIRFAGQTSIAKALAFEGLGFEGLGFEGLGFDLGFDAAPLHSGADIQQANSVYVADSSE